jgi:hypothetical protein
LQAAIVFSISSRDVADRRHHQCHLVADGWFPKTIKSAGAFPSPYGPEHIRKHELQDPKDKRSIGADEKLLASFDGKKIVLMFRDAKV